MKIPADGKGNDVPSDFSEYMWMENEEEFDQEVMKQLEEEALMEQCIEAMLEDELENKESEHSSTELLSDLQKLCVQDHENLARKSTLNPNAAEFVPKVRLDTKS
uniref:Polyadenylate-binding protein-interacting protein 2B n=1 Tax=Lygus hesperus TaxID=30085 RepID=A0A0A9XLK2_LYGHE